MIVYKVVTKDRESVISVLPFEGKKTHDFQKFVYTYKKNSIVRARKGTQGVVVFLRLRDAKKWMTYIHFCFNITGCKILRCKTIGRGTRQFFSLGFNDLFTAFREVLKKKKLKWDEETLKPSSNAACYPAVEILD